MTSAPHPMDPRALRDAFGCFMTGVTVVTTLDSTGRPQGFTANSFASVSLEPPLVLWSIRKAASSLEAFTQSGGYTVSVLAGPQEALARQFATGDMATRFAGAPVTRTATQRPRLEGALAWFDCALAQVVDAGDHLILLGRVLDFGWQDAPALAFWRSQFRTLTPQAV